MEIFWVTVLRRHYLVTKNSCPVLCLVVYLSEVEYNLVCCPCGCGKQLSVVRGLLSPFTLWRQGIKLDCQAWQMSPFPSHWQYPLLEAPNPLTLTWRTTGQLWTSSSYFNLLFHSAILCLGENSFVFERKETDTMLLVSVELEFVPFWPVIRSVILRK